LSNNLEIKRYCPDFRPIRAVLRQLGARHDVTKQQTDTYFNLPAGNGARFSRLKLRQQKRSAELIGYSDSYSGGLRQVDYEVVSASPGIKEVLAGALGISAIVKKRRELWSLKRTLFNLDTIEHVGRVFEAEIVLGPGESGDDALRYLDLLGPYLGEQIEGSNEDLVSALPLLAKGS
jgi:adenylate cyclase class IV